MKSFIQFLEATWDRQAAEKAVFSKLNIDNKSKRGGVMSIYATGQVAKTLGVDDYTTVEMSKVTDDQLKALAKLLKTNPKHFN